MLKLVTKLRLKFFYALFFLFIYSNSLSSQPGLLYRKRYSVSEVLNLSKVIQYKRNESNSNWFIGSYMDNSQFAISSSYSKYSE